VRHIETATSISEEESLVPIVQAKMTESTTDTLKDSLAPIIAYLERGSESPRDQAPTYGPLLEGERAPKRLKVSKVAFTQPAVESKIPITVNVKSNIANIISDEKVGAIVREAMAELSRVGGTDKARHEAKVMKLVKVVIRALSHDSTQALHRLLSLDDDWCNAGARKFQQDLRNAASDLEKLIIAYYTFRNTDVTLPFGSCLRNMSLVTLFREHEKLIPEVRDPESATWRTVLAFSAELAPKAPPVGLLHAYVAQKVNALETETSSTLKALGGPDIGPDVLAGRILDKYSSLLGKGILYLLPFGRSQLPKYTRDEHQAVANALARQTSVVEICRIVKNYIMKPMLDEKVDGMRSVKTFLAHWDGDMKSLEHLAKYCKPPKNPGSILY